MADDINTITRQIEIYFDALEQQICNAEQFAEWAGRFELKKIYVKKQNADIKCDLEVRLQHWPEGIAIKIYKHKALALLPACNDPQLASEHLGQPAVAAKFWKDTYYFSRRQDLDDARYVLREGNDMTVAEVDSCLQLLHGYIADTETILQS